MLATDSAGFAVTRSVADSALAGLDAPDLAQWRRLAPFQRYVLVKLSRKPKLNHDFVPAMREFGLTAAH